MGRSGSEYDSSRSFDAISRDENIKNMRDMHRPARALSIDLENRLTGGLAKPWRGQMHGGISLSE